MGALKTEGAQRRPTADNRGDPARTAICLCQLKKSNHYDANVNDQTKHKGL